MPRSIETWRSADEMDRHPTDRGAEERSGNHISNPVVIGDDNCNTQQDTDQGADRPPARCQDPEDGGDRSGDRGRARGERVPVRRAMQQTELVDAILNVAWIRPGTAEDALEYDVSRGGPHPGPGAQKRRSSPRTKQATGYNPGAAAEQEQQPHDHGEIQRRERAGEPHPCRSAAKMCIKKKRDRAIDVSNAHNDRERGRRERDQPTAECGVVAHCPFVFPNASLFTT